MSSLKKRSLMINADEVMAPMLRINGYMNDTESRSPASGKVGRGRIGAGIEEVSKGMAAAIRLPKAEGVAVSSVEKGGPAEKAGMDAGDVILRFDGKPVGNARDLARNLESVKPGSRVSIEIWRNGSRRELSIVVGEGGE